MCFEAQVIVQAFLRWSEKAGSTERANAANALGRAYLHSGMARENRDAAYMAMTYLLDDPSPRVRWRLPKRLRTPMMRRAPLSFPLPKTSRKSPAR